VFGKIGVTEESTLGLGKSQTHRSKSTLCYASRSKMKPEMVLAGSEHFRSNVLKVSWMEFFLRFHP
jgi:hypothetical protein